MTINQLFGRGGRINHENRTRVGFALVFATNVLAASVTVGLSRD